MMKYIADSDKHKMNFLLSLAISSFPARVMIVSPWNPNLGSVTGGSRDRAKEPHANTSTFQVPINRSRK